LRQGARLRPEPDPRLRRRDPDRRSRRDPGRRVALALRPADGTPTPTGGNLTPPAAASPRPVADVDVLLLGEVEQLVQAFLAPGARLLVTAEGRAEEVPGDLVHPDV